MREPGPHYPIVILPHDRPVQIRLGGAAVARTERALALHEAGFRPVLYIPREDVELSRLARAARTTFCPYKGEACSFDFTGGSTPLAAVAWSYEAPFPAVSRIRGHLAFYPDKAEVIEGE